MKLVFTTFISILLYCTSGAQDSLTCIPNTQLREAIRINERYKILKSEDSINLIKINLLNRLLFNRDTTIANYERIDLNNKGIIFATNAKYENEKVRVQIKDQVIAGLNTKVKNMRKRTWIIGGVGIATSGFLLYLLAR